MARPMKDGVDYFPLDVTTDKKFRLIEAKYGVVGFGIIIKLYQAIYADNGYYIEWDEDTALIIAAENSSSKYPLSAEAVKEIVDEAVKRDIFDKDMLDKYGILTSRGIQKRYLEATKRRSQVEIKKDYLLLSEPEISVNVNINGVNVNNNSENVCNNTQSKVKESKVNKSIVKDTITVPKEVVTAYEQNIGLVSPIILDAMADWLKDTEPDVIIWAIGEAARSNKYNWKYIEGILKNHIHAGRTSLDKIQAHNRTFSRETEKQSSVYTDPGYDYDEIERIMKDKYDS